MSEGLNCHLMVMVVLVDDVMGVVPMLVLMPTKTFCHKEHKTFMTTWPKDWATQTDGSLNYSYMEFMRNGMGAGHHRCRQQHHHQE